jgi:cathepsin A (carboxypeptidase C)
MIFLDQPVQVGYSFTSGSTPNNTPDAAVDVYAFLQLFYSKFPQYSKLPFHMAAESYGGHYAVRLSSEANEFS